MKKLILLSALLSGCASMTVHDYCQENLEHYQDYNQCYAEVSANHKNAHSGRRALSAMFTGMGQGLTNASQGSNTGPVNCTSQVAGNLVNTSCY